MTEAAQQPDEELALIFPPEKSMSGRNAEYHFCDYKQQQASYAVCLHTLLAIDENRLSSDRAPECQRAYCHAECVAAHKRSEERAAGQALYYKERRREITDPVKAEFEVDNSKSSGKYDLNNESYARGWAQVGARLKGESRPVREAAPVKKKSGFVEHDAAAVLNSMVEKATKPAPKAAPAQPQPKPAPEAPAIDPATSLSPMPGETPLAFAKRRAALQMKANQ